MSNRAVKYHRSERGSGKGVGWERILPCNFCMLSPYRYLPTLKSMKKTLAEIRLDFCLWFPSVLFFRGMFMSDQR